MDIRKTPEYKELGFNVVICPVCGKETLDNYWICENCGWEYDNTVSSDEFSDANKTTLSEARKKHFTK